jgi:hypothetical protein
MLRCAVKFCGGCNPRYDRGAAYQTVRTSLADVAAFSLPEEGVRYDVLLIIRGCTGCPYLYEEVDAVHRVLIVAESEISDAIEQIRNLV